MSGLGGARDCDLAPAKSLLGFSWVFPSVGEGCVSKCRQGMKMAKLIGIKIYIIYL